MKKATAAVAALALAVSVTAPSLALAADPPKKDPVKTVGCGIATIVTLPFVILGGKGPNC